MKETIVTRYYQLQIPLGRHRYSSVTPPKSHSRTRQERGERRPMIWNSDPSCLRCSGS